MRSLSLALAWSLSTLVATPALADTEVASERLFAPSSVRVKDEEAPQRFLQDVADHLRADRSRSVHLFVHADERLGTIDNTFLANERGKRLVKRLKRYGARGKQLTVNAIGHSGVASTPGTSRVVFDFSDDAEVPWPK